jgi:hypothetical protein
MKEFFGIIMVLFVLGFGNYQDQKQEPEVHHVSLEYQVKLLKNQKAETQLLSKFNDCRSVMASVPSAFSELENQRAKLTEEAFKDANVSEKEFNLNVETLEFEKKPAKPEPLPEKKDDKAPGL